MKVELVGKNGFIATEAIKKYAAERLQKVEQFFAKDVVKDARVVCKVYSDHHKVEVTIPTKNLLLRSEVNHEDMYAAIDESIEKLLSQVRKHKTKVKNKLEKEGIKEVFSTEIDIESLEKEVLASQIVKNKTVELKPMEVDDALHQMEQLGHSFYVFLNKSTGKICVAYIREDKDYAVIETNN